MKTGQRDFDQEAASWDKQPDRIKLTEDITRAVLDQIDLTPRMDIMDFGCATGQLTLQLHPFVHSITGVDSSPGMLDAFKMKIDSQKLKNIKTVLIEPGREDKLAGKYDLVLSSMTLHHVKEIKPLFDQFHRIIVPGGYLAIADLDRENGQFHGDNSGVFHFGFSRTALREVFEAAGFDTVHDRDAAEVLKPGINGEMTRFPVFLMTGRKRLS